MKLLKHANVYTPAPLGKRDVLIEGERILRIAEEITGYDELPDVDVYDLSGKTLVPAYIDLHVHITGGGGEQGPASRVPESSLSTFFKNGITTVVGLLGTDGITRSLENLVAKARALTEEGMTVYTLTSSYGYPPTTLTGSVERDIVLIPPMIGVKVAVSDHRTGNSCTPRRSAKRHTGARDDAHGQREGEAGSDFLRTGSLGCTGEEPAPDAYAALTRAHRRWRRAREARRLHRLYRRLG